MKDFIIGTAMLFASICEVAFGFAYLGEETILAGQMNA